MPAMKLTRVCQAACVSNHLEVAFKGKRVIANANAFVRGVQARLEPLILRRHTSRARIRVATESLDAADRKQKSATDMHQVGAESQVRSDVAASRNLAGGDQSYVIT
jgi:hypothetical protein